MTKEQRIIQGSNQYSKSNRCSFSNEGKEKSNNKVIKVRVPKGYLYCTTNSEINQAKIPETFKKKQCNIQDKIEVAAAPIY